MTKDEYVDQIKAKQRDSEAGTLDPGRDASGFGGEPLA